MNLNYVCRTCLTTEELNPIFLESVDNKLHTTAIFVTTGIKVNKDDGLPQRMCARCISFSNASLKFRKQCRDAETRLLQVKNECDGAAEALDSGAADSEDLHDKDMWLELKPELHCKIDYRDVTIKSEAENEAQDSGFGNYSPLNTTEEDLFQLKPAGGAGAAPERARARPGERPRCNTSHQQQLQLSSCFVRLKHFPNDDLHTCEICHVTIDCESSLRNHRCTNLCVENASTVSDKSAKMYFKCNICVKRFVKKSRLISHLAAHNVKLGGEKTGTQPRPHICNVCSKEFSRKQHLIRHRRKLHKDDIDNTTDKYICDICAKQFSYLSQLSNHIQVHTREKLLSCDNCMKQFTSRSNLTTHMRIHTGEKPFRCDVCKMQFTNSSHLNRHGLIHTGVKPYACSVCNKHFARNTHLTSHMRTHSGEKPFTCDVCKKQFSDKSNLTTHKLTHTGERTHPCGVCKKLFTQKSSLTRLMNTHTGTGVNSNKTHRNRKEQRVAK